MFPSTYVSAFGLLHSLQASSVYPVVFHCSESLHRIRGLWHTAADAEANKDTRGSELFPSIYMEKYDVFYKRSRDGLFAYLLRMTGDYHLSCDLVQDSFVRYLQRYSDIGERSRSLLYTIARNAAMDTFRKAKVDQFTPDSYADPKKNNPEQQLDDRQSCDTIMSAIQQLPIIDRELISLLSGADLSYSEIGRILNITEANVKVRVHRARLKLREILSSGGK